MKNNFFRTLGHSIALPFVALGIHSGIRSANKKSSRYENNPDDFEKNVRYFQVYKLVKKTLFAFNVDLEVRGLNNLVKRPMYIVPNHKSNMDPLLLTKILWEMKSYPYFNFVAKKEVLDDKKALGASKLIDSIYIDRENPRDIVKVINKQIELLKEDSIICFIEGTRVNDEQNLGEFKATALEPAYKTLAPIIPVVICGTFDTMYSGEKNRFKYKKIIVEFLEPIKHSNYINTSKEFLCEKMKLKMQDKYNELLKEIKGEDNGTK